MPDTTHRLRRGGIFFWPREWREELAELFPLSFRSNAWEAGGDSFAGFRLVLS